MGLGNEFSNINLPDEVEELLAECPQYVVADDIDQLIKLAYQDAKIDGWHDISYDVEGKKKIEAKACKLRNGIAANYVEPYMRRRDPECMVIADDLPTDKQTFQERFGYDFNNLRKETFSWLKKQNLCLFFFNAGPAHIKKQAMAIAPANAGFFALGLALLQGIVNTKETKEGFKPEAIIYVAPPFRETHFEGKQVVVHNRLPDKYEMFSYNLYPGPSAKKGVYGMLINLGEKEDWTTLHCSTVQVVTPYDNTVTIAHEGASGGGKSEMLEDILRTRDGRILLGKNKITGKKRLLTLPQVCNLKPITDDMAITPPSIQPDNGKLGLMDAENAWFIRVDQITKYGTDPHLEEITCHPKHPLLFLNIDAQPHSTALIWEHIEDAPGEPCPNPRVVLPRESISDSLDGRAVVDIRSFGVRTPVCTREKPTYGIMGLFHVLPPSLAWLWRLVSPRGFGNPSIINTVGMSSEGVGSYWPFAPGERVTQANLLLKQIIETPEVRYILIPNQHLGSWEVGFMPQWIAREYLARRGGAWFTDDQLEPARSSLLGYALQDIMIEGQQLERGFLQVDKQEEVGKEAYDKGNEILVEFFKENLKQFLVSDLDPKGKEIIECFYSSGDIQDYISLIDSEPIIKKQ